MREEVTVIRIEHAELGHGMWYDHTGKLQPQPCVADVPIPFDAGKPVSERSAVLCLEDLKAWFSDEVISNLMAAGFNLYQYTVKKFTIKENAEVVFLLNDVLDRQPITMEVGDVLN